MLGRLDSYRTHRRFLKKTTNPIAKFHQVNLENPRLKTKDNNDNYIHLNVE